MNQNKEEILERLRNVRQVAESYLAENNFENYIIKNVVRYNKVVELVQKGSENIKKFHLYVVQFENADSKLSVENGLTELELLEDENGNIYTISELIREYTGFESIKDVVDKTQENERKAENGQSEELKKDSLEILEEKKDEDEEEQEEEKTGQENKKDKKRKPSHVIERINPNKAEMNYWQTVKQAFNLPAKVDTLAFSYPVSSEDKVDYANITVYMLDKDGYIIDDLDVDDYFEFDTSTGNNPIQNDVVSHEKDENKGNAQIEGNRTMIRLKAKKSDDPNTYISLEQKSGVGDYNDINAGRKTVAGTQNVEKQLETDHVSVWDSEVEKLMKSNAGRYNMNQIFEEATEHKEHGEEEYIHMKDADGSEYTFTHKHEEEYVPGTDITWREFANSCGYRGEGWKEKIISVFNKEASKYPDTSVEEIGEKIVSKVIEDSEQGWIIPTN